MTIYIDNDFRCYAEFVSGLRECEIDELSILNGKSADFISGYRFIPDGESWTRDDGEVFRGKMISPAVDFALLDAAIEPVRIQPAYQSKSVFNNDKAGVCPVCKNSVNSGMNYCPDCGMALSWEV